MDKTRWSLLTGVIVSLLLAVTLAAQDNSPKTQDDLIKRIDSIGSTPKKARLGFDGTPVSETMDEKQAQKAPGRTEITCTGEVTFDQAKNVAVFIQDVIVKHPEFNVLCDRLTAFMKKEPKKPAADPPPAANAKEGAKSGGGIDHAIAEANPGKVVIVTQKKVDESGKVTTNIGRGTKVTFNENTGDIVLTGTPSIAEGVNLHVAEAEGTVMTLNRNGNSHTVGPSRTLLRDTNDLENGH
ncbi:MAG: hypothetical protein ABI680_00080 [Chthoniobacteraceae bacterium]